MSVREETGLEIDWSYEGAPVVKYIGNVTNGRLIQAALRKHEELSAAKVDWFYKLK